MLIFILIRMGVISCRKVYRRSAQDTGQARIRNITAQTTYIAVIIMVGRMERFIYKDIHRYTQEGDIFFDGKPVIITVHAVKRAREREVAFPDQVYAALRNGKVRRFAKNNIKFTLRSKQGTIICIGEDVGHAIIIKTVERGN